MRPSKKFDGVAFTILDDLESLVPGVGRHYEIDGLHLAAFRADERVFVVDYLCPHEDIPLTDGRVGEDGTVTCPAHLWRFRLATGENVVAGVPGVSAYETRVEDGYVFVRLP